MTSHLQRLYDRLASRNIHLLRSTALLGYEACIEDMRAFSRQCAAQFALLEYEGFYREAGDVKTWSFCWAARVSSITGRPEFPRLGGMVERHVGAPRLRDALAHGVSLLPTSQAYFRKLFLREGAPALWESKSPDLLQFLTYRSRLKVYLIAREVCDEWFLMCQFLSETVPRELGRSLYSPLARKLLPDFSPAHLLEGSVLRGVHRKQFFYEFLAGPVSLREYECVASAMCVLLSRIQGRLQFEDYVERSMKKVLETLFEEYSSKRTLSIDFPARDIFLSKHLVQEPPEDFVGILWSISSRSRAMAPYFCEWW